jgi:FADH2 O2-dependent halogenase
MSPAYLAAMVDSNPDFDVVVIGGGPAGSGMASYLAKAGVRCAVFEGALFPRPHVGESLVPSSTRVFKELDLLPVLDAANLQKKYGAAWTASTEWTASASTRMHVHEWEGLAPDCRADIRFEERAQPGVDRNYTFHVDRAQFDQLLLGHAHKLGATVYQGVKVSHVDFSDPSQVTVRFRMGQRELGVTARMVVDASGRKTMLGNQLKLKERDQVFDQYALHTWFDGYDRRTVAKSEGSENYIFVHFLPISNSWIWQIPISNTVTSIGVVTQKKNFAKSRESREQYFWDCVATRPELEAALRAAQMMRPLTDEGDYSYAMKQICGDRFVLIGDAARFVDPIFSTGVSIALNSARFASRDIIAALEKGDVSKASFSTYESTIRRGTNNWYNFISVYYRLNVLFTSFIRDPRYRTDVLKLLQGDVYDEDAPEVLVKMKAMVSDVERNPDHPWHTMLGDLTGDAFRPLY